jgi:choline transport protein
MFPPVKEVTGSNMNYCVAAFAIVFIVSVIQWFVDGRKNYTGPKLDIEALKKGEIVGMAPVDSHTGPQTENDSDNARDKRVSSEL